MLLLHAADLSLYFGLFALVCLAVVLFVNVLAARANRGGKRRTPRVEGVNRAQRRKERAETRRRQR